MAPVTEKQIIFAVSPPDPKTGTMMLLFGVTAEAWNYMKDGKTHTVDLTKAGIPFQVVMYGAPDHAAAMKLVGGFIREGGGAYLDKRNEDFAVEDLSPDELDKMADAEEAEAARLAALARRRRRGARNLRVQAK